MIHKENSPLYKADNGKMLVRKSDGKIMGDGVSLGRNDTIDNYEEREFAEEERAEFWKSIGKPDPKKRLNLQQHQHLNQTQHRATVNDKPVVVCKKKRNSKKDD